MIRKRDVVPIMRSFVDYGQSIPLHWAALLLAALERTSDGVAPPPYFWLGADAP